jgi:phosphoribosylamine-glycine ligase
MRINTSGEYQHRERTIERTQEHLDVATKTDAIMRSVDLVPRWADAIEDVLQGELDVEFSAEQKAAIADRFATGGYPVSYRVEEDVDVGPP